MNTPNSNPDEAINGSDQLDHFKADHVDGQTIHGGGKQTVIMPTIADEKGTDENAGFLTDDGVVNSATADSENGASIQDDGTIKAI